MRSHVAGALIAAAAAVLCVVAGVLPVVGAAGAQTIRDAPFFCYECAEKNSPTSCDASRVKRCDDGDICYKLIENGKVRKGCYSTAILPPGAADSGCGIEKNQLTNDDKMTCYCQDQPGCNGAAGIRPTIGGLLISAGLLLLFPVLQVWV